MSKKNKTPDESFFFLLNNFKFMRSFSYFVMPMTLTIFKNWIQIKKDGNIYRNY